MYRARAIYEMINDSIEYDDSTVCRVAGYYRTTMQEIVEQLNVKSPISLDEQNIKMQIYPNPAKESITLLTNKYVNGFIILFDVTGKKLITQEFNSVLTSIDLRPYSSGIYFVELKTGQYILRQKFIKR